MAIAALLCGLFYGAFGYAVWKKAELQRRLDRGMARLLEDLWPSGGCTCGESCGCTGIDPDPIVPGVTFPNLLGDDLDLSKAIRTGYEDG